MAGELVYFDTWGNVASIDQRKLWPNGNRKNFASSFFGDFDGFDGEFVGGNFCRLEVETKGGRIVRVAKSLFAI